MRTRLLSTLLCLTMLAAMPGASANFTDSNYHMYILYNMDQTEVDVLILPSSSPYALRDSVLMQQSVQAWDDGINDATISPSWLANGLNIHSYRVGIDNIPTSALWDPEIVIVPSEYDPVLLFGIGLELWNQAYYVPPCHGVPPPMTMQTVGELAASPAFHHHEGSPWGSIQAGSENYSGRGCGNGGSTCFVINTNFLWLPDDANRRDMYDLNSHEFGHCLGIGHVGDALDFTAANYPADDIMSYENDGHDAYHVLCVSTLDILGLKTVYGWLIGAPGYTTQVNAGTYVSMAPSAWNDVSCAEPTVGPYGLAADATAASTGTLAVCPSLDASLC